VAIPLDPGHLKHRHLRVAGRDGGDASLRPPTFAGAIAIAFGGAVTATRVKAVPRVGAKALAAVVSCRDRPSCEGKLGGNRFTPTRQMSVFRAPITANSVGINSADAEREGPRAVGVDHRGQPIGLPPV
jgi:hypothetical protein